MPRNRKSRYLAYARQMAHKYGVPWPVFASMIDHESGWNPAAISDAGAVGLGQLMPGTARGLGVDPFDPQQNLKGAAKHLSDAFHHYGNWKDALRAYNYGYGGADEDPAHGLEYANSVLAGRSRYRVAPARAKPHGQFTPEGFQEAPDMAGLAAQMFSDSPGFVGLMRQLAGPGPTNGKQPDQIDVPQGGKKASYRGGILVLPTSWGGSHITDGLNWNGGKATAEDIMATAGTPVGAPEDGTVIYWHPDGAQGGGSILFRSDSGHLYWLGHLDDGVQGGTHVRRGEVIASVSSRHKAPHVHIDRYYGQNPGRYIK